MTQGYIQSANGISGAFSKPVNSLFQEWDRDRSPGVNLAVLSEGEVVHRRGYGVANVENDVPFSPDTVLRLGSTSKHLCATCVLILQGHGLLSLDDDIRTHVAEMPDFGEVITIRNLLTMTSGLWDCINVLLFCGLDVTSAFSREQMLDLICCQKTLMYRPGDDCQYSNSNYALVSLIIERVSGKSLGDFLQDEVFSPLDMNNSALVPYDTRTSLDKARGYIPAGDNALVAGHMHIELCGDGGIDSTLTDMTRWFLNYRCDKQFGPDYRGQMEAESRLNDGRLIDYRLGISVNDYRGARKVRHAGGMPGYLCDFVYYPDEDLGIILFANMFNPRILELPDRIADIVLGDKLAEPLSSTFVPTDAPVAPLLRGLFASEETGILAEVVDDGDRLTCHLLGHANPLKETNPGAYAPADKGFSLTIVDTENALATGECSLLQYVSGCQPPVTLALCSDPEAESSQSRSDLEEYGGRYFSEELNETNEISVQGKTLQIVIPGPLRTLVWKTFRHLTGDLFCSVIKGEPSRTNVSVRFTRNEKGAVTGFLYNINRCHGVPFSKVQTP